MHIRSPICLLIVIINKVKKYKTRIGQKTGMLKALKNVAQKAKQSPLVMAYQHLNSGRRRTNGLNSLSCCDVGSSWSSFGSTSGERNAINTACMCVCVYVCMYVYIHVCMCACVCVCVYVCMYPCMYASGLHLGPRVVRGMRSTLRACVCVCVCMYVCMYVYIHVCMYLVFIWVHER